MDKGYEMYCLVDPLFYDSPERLRREDLEFDVGRRPAPPGWERSELHEWLMYWPTDARLPLQGWKIHASGCLSNAEDIIKAVWDYCIPRGIAFKFLRGRHFTLLRNVKYASRGSSGKLVTIYPVDETQLEVVLNELGAILDGQPGPYILSDLRCGNGPLYVRYGGFAERYVVATDGEPVPAIADGDGNLVPDRREPAFEVPPWVTLPDFLAPHMAARNSVTVTEIPYEIERAAHFSNAGGLYVGRDRRTGAPVVLKEARPHAGLSWDGADAIARLHRERDVLQKLAGLDVVPAVLDDFMLGDHYFLVLEFIEATALSTLLVEKNPVAQLDLDDDKVAEYASWAVNVHGRVEDAVSAIHQRDIVIGDLHPYNVMVRPDGRIVLLDFEVAASVDENRAPTLADPAFWAPPGRTGFEIDRYALACLRLFYFLPLTTLLQLDRAKAEEFAAVIAEVFPVPREFLAYAVGVITGEPRYGLSRWRPKLEPGPWGWREARDSMTGAILASATPARDDRLFPGDIQQFSVGGLGLAHGAAGVLYALATTGAGRYSEHEEWLVRRATQPQQGTRLGLYDGLFGVAYVLDVLDHQGTAQAVLDLCFDDIRGKWERLGQDLDAGLAGIGLVLSHFGLWDEVWRVVDVVAERLGAVDSVDVVSGGDHPFAGLVRGSSGPALLFVRLYERTGDTRLLDLAGVALRQDLRRCVHRRDGAIEVNEGWRTMPYLKDGSVGIGIVLDDYLVHRVDQELADAAASIRQAATSLFYVEPGLFYGRAGMVLYLSRGHEPGAADADPIVADQIRRLSWHSLAYEGHLAFPGEQLMRLSMDLASGTAGVLLAVGAALHDKPVHLPFLGPVSSFGGGSVGGRSDGTASLLKAGGR